MNNISWAGRVGGLTKGTGKKKKQLALDIVVKLEK